VNNQATVKRFYLHKDSPPQKDIHRNPQVNKQTSKQNQTQESQIELRPANATMESMWFSPQVVHVQGVVVGLIRRL
jgi:SOS-response transcriptional repressor LexA